MELGQYSEFLGVMQANEMLSRWFINDASTASQDWRLKRHAETDFWDWVGSWARAAELPSDLGGSDDGFVLPPVKIVRHRSNHVDVKAVDGDLFAVAQVSATTLHTIKRQTAEARAAAIASVIEAEPGEAWIIWCDTDYEADALARVIPDCVEVRGSLSADVKEQRLEAFGTGAVKRIITKPTLAGFGLDWSHCARQAFVGRGYSYETFYQAVRRSQRFGQKRQVVVHIAVAEGEDEIGRVVERKVADHLKMKVALRAAMARAKDATRDARVAYEPQHKGRLPTWLKSDA
jgi:hypothetical protein